MSTRIQPGGGYTVCANSLVVQPYTWLVGRQRAGFTIHRKRWIDRNKMQNAMGRASMCLLLSSPFFHSLYIRVRVLLLHLNAIMRTVYSYTSSSPPHPHPSPTHRACVAHSATSITPSSTTTAGSGSGCTKHHKKHKKIKHNVSGAAQQ